MHNLMACQLILSSKVIYLLLTSLHSVFSISSSLTCSCMWFYILRNCQSHIMIWKWSSLAVPCGVLPSISFQTMTVEHAYKWAFENPSQSQLYTPPKSSLRNQIFFSYICKCKFVIFLSQQQETLSFIQNWNANTRRSSLLNTSQSLLQSCCQVSDFFVNDTLLLPQSFPFLSSFFMPMKRW